MHQLDWGHVLSIVITLGVVSALGILAGRKVKSEADFSVGGRKAGASMVAGSIMGTLIGGSSTVGTAELAFRFGYDAWWFTLGAGIGCLVLAFFLLARYASQNWRLFLNI